MDLLLSLCSGPRLAGSQHVQGAAESSQRHKEAGQASNLPPLTSVAATAASAACSLLPEASGVRGVPLRASSSTAAASAAGEQWQGSAEESAHASGAGPWPDQPDHQGWSKTYMTRQQESH